MKARTYARTRGRQRRWLGGLGLLVVGLGLAWSALEARRSAAERGERYNRALALALGKPYPDTRQRSTSRYPARRLLNLPVTPARVGLLDFWDMQGCTLGVLVGERNSPLGRVMAASERFIYEAALVKALPTCQTGDPELQAQLAEIHNLRQRELPRHRFMALWSGPEIRALFRAESSSQAAAAIPGAVQALDRLAAAAQLPLGEPNRVRRALQNLYQHSAAGGLLSQLHNATVELEASVGLLPPTHTAIADLPCQRGSALREAFRNHYIGSFQPALATLATPASQLVDALIKLWNESHGADLAPPELVTYMNDRVGLKPGRTIYDRFIAASRQHAAAMQHLGTGCNLQFVPGTRP